MESRRSQLAAGEVLDPLEKRAPNSEPETAEENADHRNDLLYSEYLVRYLILFLKIPRIRLI